MDRAEFFAHLRKKDSGVFGTSLSQGQVDGINATLAAGRTLPLAHMAYALATEYGETGRKMQPVEENLRYSAKRIPQVFGPLRRQGVPVDRLAYNPELLANTVYGGEWGAKTLGNRQPGDGWRFRGRGKPQVTGRRNYERIRDLTGVDVVAHPELMLRQDVSSTALVAAMRFGIFTGKSASDYLPSTGPATREQYRTARQIINGLFAADAYAEWAVAFQAALIAGDYAPAQQEAPVKQKPATAPQEAPTAGYTPDGLGGLLTAILRALASIFGKMR